MAASRRLGATTIEFDHDEIERLARAEHERWRTFMERRKYRVGPRSSVGRLHPDLVEWAVLDEETREVDGALIRGLPELLARAGFLAYRKPG